MGHASPPIYYLSMSNEANFLKRSFSYSGAVLWNNLPKCLKNAVSVNNFKQIIKKIADIIGFPHGNHVKQL